MSNPNNIVVILDKFDSKYMYRLREYFTGASLKIITHEVNLFTQVKSYCISHDSTKVVTTSWRLLRRLVQEHDANVAVKDTTFNNYRGSVFYIDNIQVLILPSPKTLNYIPIDPWLFKRWIQKIRNPNFPVFPKLDYKILNSSNLDSFLKLAKSAILISIDIETKKELVDVELLKDNPEELRGIWTLAKKSPNSKKMVPVVPMITMVGYSLLLRRENGELYSTTGVLRITSIVDIYYMRNLNLTKAPKILQNGGYDITYFLRYNAPIYNYLYDTFIGMHSWLVELPRNLSFITSLFNRDHIYWKDEGEFSMVEYNAKDAHNTLWSWIYLIYYWPDYASSNYAENFRMQFPCIHAGLEGFRVNHEEKDKLQKIREKAVQDGQKRLEEIIMPGYNPGSPIQNLALIRGLGFKDAKDTKDSTMQDFIDSHPLYSLIGGLIQDVKKDRKAISTYFEVILFSGRFLFELNPGGTDTGRLASKASNLWCGGNVQNQPPYTKSMYLADEGYELNSIDSSQAESRCTAYISEDKTLLFNVEDTTKDFHQTNGSAFFGVAPELIVGSKPGDLRWSSKKVNHGANYNMGWRVLLQTMGRKAVKKAARLIKLPATWTMRKICEYLLNQFDKTYPDVRGKMYSEIIEEIQKTGLLVGATGWTRRCFGDPTTSKPILNSYIAHGPQSLSVKKINNAYFETWLKLQLVEKVIRLKPQVHDEIIWQSKPEHTEYSTKVIKELMELPTKIKGRVMVIPTVANTGGKSWADLEH